MPGPRPRRDDELLAYIERYIADVGWAPTYREMAAAVGYRSLQTVQRSLDRLVEAGRLVRKDGSTRALRLASSEER